MEENKYYMENWKPQEDVGVIFDDQTAEDRDDGTMNQMIDDLREVANNYDFDLNMWNHGYFIGFKKTSELAKEINKEDKDKASHMGGVGGSAFTKEDLEKAYNNGSRQGSVNGMRVARGGEMNVKTFDEWYDEHYRLK